MRLDAEQLSDLNVRIAQKVFNANMDGSLFMLLRRMGMDYLLDEVNGVDTGNPMGDSRRLVPELWRTTPTCTRSFDCGAAPLSLRLPPDLVLDFGGVIGLAHVGKAAHGVLITSATLKDKSGNDEADWKNAEKRTGVFHFKTREFARCA